MEDPSPIRIAFYDSGVGGLPYFKRAKELIPGASFSYLADSANFPLGDKPRDVVASLVKESVRRLMEASSPDLVVVACNTASVMALDELRSSWPGFPFVGTVPAVKPAVAATRSGKVAVIATARTAESPYMADLIARFAEDKEVFPVAAPTWAEFVETRWLSSGPEERKAAVEPVIAPLRERGVDVYVLACTHFLYLAEDVAAAAGKGSLVIDSSDGVAKRVADLMGSVERRGGGGESGLWSSAPAPRVADFAAHFGLEYRGVIP